MKKRIFSMLVVLTMIVGMLPTVAFADGDDDSGTSTDVELTDTLDLTTYSGSGTEPGYTWDSASSTLTITSDLSITISNGPDAGIDVPAGTTIDLGEYDLTISVPGRGIYTAGEADTTLTIEGSGTLDVTTDADYAIYAQTGDITIEGTSDSDSAKITVEANSSDMGIRANSGDISIKNATVTATITNAYNSGIFAVGDLTIDNSTVTSAATDPESGYRGIAVSYDLTISGTSNMTASYIDIGGDCSIPASATITATCIDVDGELSISGNPTLEIAEYIYNKDTYTLYGNIADAGWMFSSGNYAVAFAENSSLTISENSTTDLSDYIIDWTNAVVTNNGTLILPDDTNLSTLSSYITFGTDAYIVVDGTVYDADGDTVHDVYSGTLTLSSSSATDGIAYGFTWTDEDKNGTFETLTVTEAGLTIIASDGDGLVLPTGATIVLDGDLDITATDYGISAAGDLEIKGTGDLTIVSDGNGIDMSSGGSNMYYASPGQSQTSTLTIETTGDVNFYGADGNYNIYADGDVSLANGEFILNSWSGVYATGALTIHNAYVYADGVYGDSATITNSALDIMYLSSDNITIDADSTGYIYEICAYDEVIITEGAKIEVYLIYATNGATFTTNDTLNNFIYTYDGESADYEAYIYDYQTKIYGEVSLEDWWIYSYYYGDDIIVTEGSTLTIATGATLDLNAMENDYAAGSIDFTDGTLIVNGVLIYPYDTNLADIDFAAITGIGYIVVYGVYYDTDGETIEPLTGFTLDSDEVTTDDYTWLADEETDVYTLTFTGETVVAGEIEILDRENGIEAIIVVDDSVMVTDGINISGDLTIEGDGTLSTGEIYSNSDNCTLTIDTTVNAYIYWYGDLIVNGDLTAAYVKAGNMTVNTGATVEITTNGLTLVGTETEAPTLTLGDNVSILTPADGTYETAYEYDNYECYIGAITTDGKAIDADNLSNYAYEVSIGATPSTSSGSSNTGTLVTDTEETTTEDTEEETTTTVATVGGFDDVLETTYYAEAVEWAVENDVTTGTSDNGFSPDSPASRGQVVTFLYRAFGEPETDGENTFGDVDEDSYYGDSVKWALEMGITSGMEDGIFGTEETCTRAQIITFMWRAAGSPEMDGDHDFTDVEADNYYNQAILWAVENGITNGMGDGTFGSDEPCTRAQIVTFLYRFFN